MMRIPLMRNSSTDTNAAGDTASILIVEDDADIRDGIKILLESESYHVLEAGNGREGLDLFSKTVDLVILDVMMPGMSGITVCKKLRETSNVPILFLTAKSQESDKVAGLMAGGDDYLTKPFTYGELLGRVKALLRRYKVYQGKNDGSGSEGDYIEKAGIRISKEFNKVTVDGSDKNLTEIEYQLLLLMMQNPQKVFTAQELYETIWQEPYFYSCSNTLMVHIRNLRTKVERKPQEPERIRTVWGKGYMFNERNQ